MRQDSCSRSAGLAASSSRTIDSHWPGANRRGAIAEIGQSLPTMARSAPNASSATSSHGRHAEASVLVVTQLRGHPGQLDAHLRQGGERAEVPLPGSVITGCDRRLGEVIEHNGKIRNLCKQRGQGLELVMPDARIERQPRPRERAQALEQAGFLEERQRLILQQPADADRAAGFAQRLDLASRPALPCSSGAWATTPSNSGQPRDSAQATSPVLLSGPASTNMTPVTAGAPAWYSAGR